MKLILIFVILSLLTYATAATIIITKKTRYTYYIIFSGINSEKDHIESWVIRETDSNMGTPRGLEEEINSLCAERGYPIIIKNWKLLGTRWKNLF